MCSYAEEGSAEDGWAEGGSGHVVEIDGLSWEKRADKYFSPDIGSCLDLGGGRPWGKGWLLLQEVEY